MSASSRAASSSASSPASTSPTSPANAADPILALVPADRRATLLAKPDPAKPGLYRFDIHLQGPDETVFFDA